MAEADAIIVSTEQERSDVTRLYGTDSAKISVLPAGVDLELFRPTAKSDARQSLGLTDGNVVLSVGQCRAAQGVRHPTHGNGVHGRDLSDTTVVIVGGDEESSPELERLRAL